ncbi:MAG TPA: hypothetical protein VLL51_03070, partial [Gemmatimonadales bacterium]|nr:hypothetical protein [Gemmatimonadales bacterium]
ALLPDSAARQMAEAVLRTGDPGADRLAVVSIEPERRADRTDWEVTYRDPAVKLPEGEARVTVSLAGSEVTGVGRVIHVPEAWEREWTASRSVRGLVPLASGLLYVLLLIGLLVVSVVRWTRHRLNVRVVAAIASFMLPVALLELANGWPALQAGFSTAEPWRLQAVYALGGGAVLAAFAVALGALVTGLGLPAVTGDRSANRAGVALGAAVGGVLTLVGALADSPPSGASGHLDAALPALSALLSVPLGFLVLVTLMSLVLFVGSRIGPLPGRVLWYLAAGSIGTATATQSGAGGMAAAWLAGAVVLTAADLAARRWGGGVILSAAATWAALTAFEEVGRGGLSSEWLGVAAGAALLAVLIRALRPATV